MLDADAFDYSAQGEFLQSPLAERNNIICPAYPGALGDTLDFIFVHESVDSLSGDGVGFPIHTFGVAEEYGSTGLRPGHWRFSWEATATPHQDPFSSFWGSIAIYALHVDHITMADRFDNAGERRATDWLPGNIGPQDTPASGQFDVFVRDWCLWRLYFEMDSELSMTFHISGTRLD